MLTANTFMSAKMFYIMCRAMLAMRSEIGDRMFDAMWGKAYPSEYVGDQH